MYAFPSLTSVQSNSEHIGCLDKSYVDSLSYCMFTAGLKLERMGLAPTWIKQQLDQHGVMECVTGYALNLFSLSENNAGLLHSTTLLASDWIFLSNVQPST